MFKKMNLFLVAALAAGVMSCSASEPLVIEDPANNTITVTSTLTPEEYACHQFLYALSGDHWTMVKCSEDGNGPDVEFELNELGKLACKIYDLEQALKAKGLETSEELELFKKAYEAGLQPGIMQKLKTLAKALYAKKGVISAIIWDGVIKCAGSIALMKFLAERLVDGGIGSGYAQWLAYGIITGLSIYEGTKLKTVQA